MKSKNKQKKAAALAYRPEKDKAPRIVAKGKGQMAEKILAMAKEHNIYVHKDPDLIGGFIPA